MIFARNFRRVTLDVSLETWRLSSPLRITGSTIHQFEVMVIRLERNGRVGRGEAMGVAYRGDSPSRMRDQIEQLRPAIEAGDGRDAQLALAPGGARNALDCALWELESSECGEAVWKLAGLSMPVPVLTTYTIGAADPADMARAAQSWPEARALKLKLTGEPEDAERVRSVRQVRPDAWIGVDANQGLTPDLLEKLMPTLLASRVSLVEQPFPAAHDEWLDGLRCPIEIAADESVQCLDDLVGLGDRWDVLNIKLDKCGGLSEALQMVAAIRQLGKRSMIGVMGGTSLAMAPAFLVGQLCDYVDVDGPLFLSEDRRPSVAYHDGSIWCPEAVWGGG